MRTRFAVAAGTLGLLTVFQSAQANVLTQTADASTTHGSSNSSSGGTSSPNFNFFTPFDPTLGTLTGASLRFFGTLTPETTVAVQTSSPTGGPPPGNVGRSAPAPSAVVTNPVTLGPAISIGPELFYPGATTSLTLASETLAFAPLGSPYVYLGAIPGYPFNYQNYQALGAPEVFDIASTIPTDQLQAFLNSYSFFDQGIPSINFTGTTPVSVVPYFNYSDNTVTTAQVQLTYTYTPSITSVPEPALLSLGLLGTGAIWLAFARRQPRTLA